MAAMAPPWVRVMRPSRSSSTRSRRMVMVETPMRAAISVTEMKPFWWNAFMIC
jgi:hypothetical protein